MHINFHGQVTDEPEITVGFIGCGSHSFRNLYAVLQFTHIELKAVCDLDKEKAEAFAAQFGSPAVYTDIQQMLEAEELDAVLLCTGYDQEGRPTYPRFARTCLEAGVHVWMEKPAAATSAELEDLKPLAEEKNLIVMTGFKKMFFPANVKAKELMKEESFGTTGLVQVQYPLRIPDHKDVATFIKGGERVEAVGGFMDHLCHPASLMVHLLGMPQALVYERSTTGSGMALFTFENGEVCAINMTGGAAMDSTMEYTQIVGDNGQHITVENNIRVVLHKRPQGLPYGKAPSYFTGEQASGSVVWEPEFSLGNLYNKGVFIQGFYGELEEFAQAVLNNRQPSRATLDDAIGITKLFEAFANPAGSRINL